MIRYKKGVVMSETIEQILEKISSLEKKLQEELQKEDKLFDFSIKGKKVCFNKKLVSEQKEHIEDIFTYLKNAPILYVLTAPIIYGLIIPAIILDISVSFYQAINFRVYKIALVKRSDYIVFDRGYLAYLNILEKINCLYCSYFNGLMAYVSEVAARTEQFWCPIKHAKKIAYRHSRYHRFLSYGDAKKYRQELENLRKELQNLKE
jgi:hypothetical protein